MDWKQAEKWKEEANSTERNYDMEWSWDCGFKLDYDGPLIHVSSRFYKNNGDIFDGSVSFYIGDECVFTREFSCRHINILREDVLEYVASVRNNIHNLVINNISVFITKDMQK